MTNRILGVVGDISLAVLLLGCTDGDGDSGNGAASPGDQASSTDTTTENTVSSTDQLPDILSEPLTDRPNSAEGEVWVLEELIGIDVDVVAAWANSSDIRFLVAHDDRPDLDKPARLLNFDPDRLYVRARDNMVTEAVMG